MLFVGKWALRKRTQSWANLTAKRSWREAQIKRLSELYQPAFGCHFWWIREFIRGIDVKAGECFRRRWCVEAGCSQRLQLSGHVGHFTCLHLEGQGQMSDGGDHCSCLGIFLIWGPAKGRAVPHHLRMADHLPWTRGRYLLDGGTDKNIGRKGSSVLRRDHTRRTSYRTYTVYTVRLQAF